MHKILAITLALSAGLLGTVARAADDTDSSGQTVRNAEERPNKGTLKGEVVGIKPQVGAATFNQKSIGGGDSRMVYGFTLDFNAINMMSNPSDSMQSWYIGPSTGFLYSNLGGPGANFFASTSNTGTSSNVFQIPLDLKVGYNLGTAARISLHGGGNLIRRSDVTTVALGTPNPTLVGSDTAVFPNIGADLEFGLGKNFGLILRPDATLTKGPNIYTGTIGLSALFG